MSEPLRHRLIEIVALMFLVLAGAAVMPRANAALIATDAALPPAAEREHLKALLARPEVAQQLQKLGLSASEASVRVDAMSDAEVASLAGRIDALPAGGAITNQELGLIILLVVLVLLLI
jgi:hypothetical protein